MKDADRRDSVLGTTRGAIEQIEQETIRSDLLRFVSGAELCLQHQEVPLALDCVRTIATTVMALERTLTAEVVAEVLGAIEQDSQTTAQALRRGLGFTKHHDAKCDIKPGTPIGSSPCLAKQNSVCYTLSSGSGCGGPSGFQFVWEVARAVG